MFDLSPHVTEGTTKEANDESSSGIHEAAPGCDDNKSRHRAADHSYENNWWM